MKISAPPLTSQFLTPDGRISDVWGRWFRQLADKANRESIPEGGATGQLLKKASGSDFDSTWSNP